MPAVEKGLIMNQKNGTSTTVLLISNDRQLFEQLDCSLQNRFGIELHCFTDKEIRNSLLIQKPLFLIWDGRILDENWPQTISWLRDHFHGLPILALTNEPSQSIHEQLTRLGVVQQFDTKYVSWSKNLLVHIFAVILDHEQQDGFNVKKEYIGKFR